MSLRIECLICGKDMKKISSYKWACHPNMDCNTHIKITPMSR